MKSFLVLIAILPSIAFADCQWNSDRSFFGCDTLGIASSVGRTLPAIGDSIRFNPASLPTVPTPIGVEAIYSSHTVGEDRLQGSIIKGYPYVGIGAASWTENSFATPIVQRYLRALYASAFQQYERSTGTGFRAGAALGIPLGRLEGAARVSVGASFGQGRVSGSSSSSFGITADGPWLSAGLSRTSETISPLFPKATTDALSFGLHHDGFYAGFTRMAFTLGALEQQAILFYSVRWASERWAVHGSLKRDVDEIGNRKNEKNAGLQFFFGKHFVLGYMYGLYPRSHSMTAQFFF